MARPPPAGTPPPPAGGLKELKSLYLDDCKITDAGCATLAAALSSGALPALGMLDLDHITASASARAAVYEARANLMGGEFDNEEEQEARVMKMATDCETDGGRSKITSVDTLPVS